MPRGFYKVIRVAAIDDEQKNPNPIVWTPEVAIQTSSQVTDYFLCRDCEQRFNARGEKWVIENCWRSDVEFPLRAILNEAPPLLHTETGVTFYAGTKIAGADVDKLAYLGASVFWRAGAREWSPIAGHVPTRLGLGPYAEKLRLFLLDRSPFPMNVSMIVTVNSTKDPGANESVVFPYHSKKESGCNRYRFLIPGVSFQLFVGKTMAPNLRKCCLIHSEQRLVFLGPNDFIASGMWKLMQKGQPKGSLAAHIAFERSEAGD